VSAGTDVVVVGAGVIGLAVAWRLARDGAGVRLLDASGSRGASWVAAGMLAPGSEAEPAAPDLLRLHRAALARFRAAAPQLEADAGTAIGLRSHPTLLVARDADDWAALRRHAAHREALGVRLQPLTAAERREREPFLAPDLRGALLVADDVSVDNRRYLAALLAALARHGVEREPARARALRWAGGRVAGVRTAEAELAADVVVLATGSRPEGLAGWPEGLVVPVRPVKGQILRLGRGPGEGRPEPPLRQTIRALVHGAEVYLVPRDTGEVVVGATVEEQGHDTTVTAGAVLDLLRDACAVVPRLRELALVECAAGSRPGTPDNGPLVGPTGTPGLVLATGHHRNGVLLSALTADAVLAAVHGRAPGPEWRPFAPDRFSRRTGQAVDPDGRLQTAIQQGSAG
jgi:glycine oxidase